MIIGIKHISQICANVATTVLKESKTKNRAYNLCFKEARPDFCYCRVTVNFLSAYWIGARDNVAKSLQV